MVTIKQIAERAGVSTATVSNVIHGKTKKVSPETVEKVCRLIDEMGYVQRMGLRVLRNDSSQLVAVIINNHLLYDTSVLTDPFYGTTIGVIEEELRKRGYYMMFYSSPDIDDIFKMIMTWDVDGVIALSVSKSDCEKIYNMTRKPVVSIDAHGKRGELARVPNISADDLRGGYLMAQHLLEQGYEAVYVCGYCDYGIDFTRWLGAQKAYNELFSVQNIDGRRRTVQFLCVGNSLEAREEYYRQLIRKFPFERKTALFFTADSMAMEAISIFREHGIRIPEDVGIAGFDDIRAAARYCVPRLTTIHQDVNQKALLAVDELVKVLSDSTYKPKDHIIPISLVSRNSV